MSTVGLARPWQDHLDALGFASKTFDRWHEAQALRDDQIHRIRADLDALRQHWEREANDGRPPPTDSGVPPAEPVTAETAEYARQHRFGRFVAHLIRRYEADGLLTLAQSHALLEKLRGRGAALARKIVWTEPAAVELAEGSAPAPRQPRQPRQPRRPLLEIVLDPQNIQWLLVFGGGMLVAGLVLYLYTLGVFENATVVAVLLGAATLGLLVGGWAVVLRTRYQTAGRALTLLACLVLPLNLWFYHAQGLHPFLLHEQLWIAALVCCVLYAVSAYILRDSLFVYVLVLGVTGTSVLLLGSVLGPERFWHITDLAILLTVLGLVTLHVERAFPEGEGDFSRRRFGLPFFWSGHVVLAAGLLCVLGAQVYGWLYALPPLGFARLGFYAPAPLVTELPLRVLALLLVLACTYAYTYSDVVVRRRGFYLYAAVFTLLWAELLAIGLLGIDLTGELAIAAMALTALAANLLAAVSRGQTDEEDPLLARAAYPLGVGLAVVPVALGVLLHLASSLSVMGTSMHPLGWPYVAAMALAAVSCRVAAHLHRQTRPTLSAIYLFGAAAATLVGLAGLLSVAGLETWEQQALILMLLPAAYLVAAWVYRGSTSEVPFVWCGHVAALVLLAWGIVALGVPDVTLAGRNLFLLANPETSALAIQNFFLRQGDPANLFQAAFFAEVALFYGLAAGLQRHRLSVYLMALSATAAVWQLLNYAQVPEVGYILAFAGIGLALLAAYRFGGLSLPAFACANALLSLSAVGGVLLTLKDLMTHRPDEQGVLLGMQLALIAASLAAAVLVNQAEWRRWYVLAAVALAGLMIVTFVVLTGMRFEQKVEVACVLLGGMLLIVGHAGWYREDDHESDVVGFSLFLGCVLTAVPLTVAVIAWRHANEFHIPDEVGMLALGIGLFASGSILRLRWTTVTGALLLFVWAATLLIYLPWSKLDAAAIALMVGGGSVFLVGLLLSVYRDRLLALPELVRRREGVFRVIGWR